MPKALLDTDIFSELMRDKNLVVRARASAYLASEKQLTISSITVLEVIKGLHKVQREPEIERFLATLSTIEVISVSVEEAIEAGRIYAELERTGQPIGRADPMIAAVAIVHGLVLVTGNEVHYRRIQELPRSLAIDNWRNPAP